MNRAWIAGPWAWGWALLLVFLGGGCARAPRPVDTPKSAGTPGPGGAPATVRAPAKPVEPELTLDERELEILSFDFAWNTIRQKHWDPTLGGLNWEAVRDSLRPQVKAAKTRTESRHAMEKMIATLGQSHFGIIPTQVYDQMEGGGGEGVPGLELAILGGHAIVSSVDAASPAYANGVRAGWELLQARGADIPVKLAAILPSFAGKTTQELIVTRSIAARLQGAIGDTVAARFLDGAGQSVDVRLPLIRPKGNLTTLGNLPPVYAYTEQRTLEGGFGYIKISIFLDPGSVMANVATAVRDFHGAPGIVLDLRGNMGGLGAMAMGVAGWFVPEKGRKLGTMIMRGNQLNFTIMPRPETYAGRLAILVDGESASTTEILAAGLQDLKRARVFGTRSAGAALPSIIERLPNGDGFQYAVANYLSEGGQALEGNGVTPDSTVVFTRESLLAGHDVQLEAAMEWIRTGK